MIFWAPLDPAPDLTKAVPCSINTGVLNDQGTKVLLPGRIYVDNALTLTNFQGKHGAGLSFLDQSNLRGYGRT